LAWKHDKLHEHEHDKFPEQHRAQAQVVAEQYNDDNDVNYVDNFGILFRDAVHASLRVAE
jgi:hypothetical protein